VFILANTKEPNKFDEIYPRGNLTVITEGTGKGKRHRRILPANSA
jgi:hypothetical protein